MKFQKIAIIVSLILLTPQSLASDTLISKLSNKNPHQIHNHNESMHKIKNKNTEKEKVYLCPMHPEIMSEKKGSCPICGMKLKEVELEEE